jgi:hypothetical protein
MKGSFSEEALLRFAELSAESRGLDFSEGSVYDFTRCIRPDGSTYGTGGRCRKGSETGAKEAPSPKSPKSIASKFPNIHQLASSMLDKVEDSDDEGEFTATTDRIRSAIRHLGKTPVNGPKEEQIRARIYKKLIGDLKDYIDGAADEESIRLSRQASLAQKMLG